MRCALLFILCFPGDSSMSQILIYYQILSHGDWRVESFPFPAWTVGIERTAKSRRSARATATALTCFGELFIFDPPSGLRNRNRSSAERRWSRKACQGTGAAGCRSPQALHQAMLGDARPPLASRCDRTTPLVAANSRWGLPNSGVGSAGHK